LFTKFTQVPAFRVALVEASRYFCSTFSFHLHFPLFSTFFSKTERKKRLEGDQIQTYIFNTKSQRLDLCATQPKTLEQKIMGSLNEKYFRQMTNY